MTRAPTLAAIDAVEMKFAASRRDTREGLQRAYAALRAKAPKQATLVIAAGAVSLAGLWFARRGRGPAAAARVGAGVALSAAVAAIGRTLLARYGVRGATFVVAQARAAWSRRAERIAAETVAAPSRP
jgi:hypothetical protein